MLDVRSFFLLAGAICFGLGISLPLMEFERLFFLSETPSLLDIIAGLWSGGEAMLAIIVAGFSIIFPVTKLMLVGGVFKTGGRVEWLASILSKWSMTDVLLVAIAVFAVKTSGMANAATQPGIWFYGLSGVFVAIASLSKNDRRVRQ